jgi:nicotinic acetylcholine receptor
MHVPNKSTPKPPVGSNHKGTRPNDIGESSSKSLLANVLDINDDYFNKSSSRFKSRPNSDSYVPHARPVPPGFNKPESDEEDYANDPNPIKRNLGAILKELKTMTQKIEDDEADEEKILSWKFAAMVIDRMCMVIFSIATFLSTALILLTSENFFKFV